MRRVVRVSLSKDSNLFSYASMVCMYITIVRSTSISKQSCHNLFHPAEDLYYLGDARTLSQELKSDTSFVVLACAKIYMPCQAASLMVICVSIPQKKDLKVFVFKKKIKGVKLYLFKVRGLRDTKKKNHFFSWETKIRRDLQHYEQRCV